MHGGREERGAFVASVMERTVLAKKVVTVVVCLVVTAAGVYMAWPKGRIATPNPEDYRRPWVCDACGHTFDEPPGEGMRECPKCGAKKGAQVGVYVCKACGEEFEAYRFADFYTDSGDAGPDGKPLVPATYYKLPGSQWKIGRPDPKAIVCPKCGNRDPAKLEERRFVP